MWDTCPLLVHLGSTCTLKQATVLTKLSKYVLNQARLTSNANDVVFSPVNLQSPHSFDVQTFSQNHPRYLYVHKYPFID